MLQVYPQGCDVCNHLSLFLCVADYDKLLPGTFWMRGTRIVKPVAWLSATSTSSGHQPCCSAAGWSHFAQFTIAVVNKDPKKSKYSGQQQFTSVFHAAINEKAVLQQLCNSQQLLHARLYVHSQSSRYERNSSVSTVSAATAADYNCV